MQKSIRSSIIFFGLINVVLLSLLSLIQPDSTYARVEFAESNQNMDLSRQEALEFYIPVPGDSINPKLFIDYRVQDYEPLTLKIYMDESEIFSHSGYQYNNNIGLLPGKSFTIQFLNEEAGNWLFNTIYFDFDIQVVSDDFAAPSIDVTKTGNQVLSFFEYIGNWWGNIFKIQ